MFNRFHNTGEHPNNVIQDIKNAGIVVYAIGVGDSVDTGLLSNIASQTSGKFFHARSSAELASIFATLFAESTDQGGAITKALSPIIAGEQKEEVVLIDSVTPRATFLVSWPNGDLDLTLTKPDGSVIDPVVALADPSVEFIQGPVYKLYTVSNPQAGQWEMVITAINVPGQVEYTAQVFGESSVLAFTATPDKGSYAFPEKVSITAQVVADVNVLGAKVNGTVIRPDGTMLPIVLFDDGSNSHGDQEADDGVYSNLFNNYNEDGTYTFRLAASTNSGTLFAGEGLFTFPTLGFILLDPDSGVPAPTFNRTTEFSVIISGVPPFVTNQTPIANAGSDQILECTDHTGTSAILDGSASHDPDGDVLGYLWQGIFGASNDISPTVPLPLGSHTITLAVNDGRGASDSDEVTIAVTDSTPPTLSAQWIPLDAEDAEGEFRLDFTAVDICDPAVTVRGIIKIPSLDGLEVDLKVAPNMKIEFDFKKNKLEVRGPDPAGVFAQLQNLGGLIVESGQIVQVESEKNNNKFEMKFEEKGILKIEAHQPTLKVTGYDRSGNVATVEAVPTFLTEEEDDD